MEDRHFACANWCIAEVAMNDSEDCFYTVATSECYMCSYDGVSEHCGYIAATCMHAKIERDVSGCP